MTKEYIANKIRNYFEKKYEGYSLSFSTINDVEYIVADVWDEKINKFCLANGDLWDDILIIGEDVHECMECFQYHWMRDMHIVNEELLCEECIKECYIDDYIDERVNNPENANNLLSNKELEDLGWQKTSRIYYHGMYKGHNADPKTILKSYLKDFPNDKFMFSIVDQNPYEVSFELWHYVED